MIQLSDLFRFRSSLAKDLLTSHDSIWAVLGDLRHLTASLLGDRRNITGTVMTGAHIYDGPVFIGSGAIVEPGAYVAGPAYIGPNVTIRQGAYIRGNCVLLEGAILGHASEAKNAIFLEGAKAPHFAYVGDSILGADVNLGAGTKLSNVKISRRPGDTISIPDGNGRTETGLAKLGAVLGDEVQIGCNAVTSPGCLVGARSMIYANVTLRSGLYAPDSVIKLRQELAIVPRGSDVPADIELLS